MDENSFHSRQRSYYVLPAISGHAPLVGDVRFIYCENNLTMLKNNPQWCFFSLVVNDMNM